MAGDTPGMVIVNYKAARISKTYTGGAQSLASMASFGTDFQLGVFGSGEFAARGHVPRLFG